MAKITDSQEHVLTTKWYYSAARTINTHPDNLKAEQSQAWDGLIQALAIMVWGKNRKTVRYPKTWIDALKLRWFPKWALKKWPPIIVKVKWDEILPLLSTKNESSIVFVKSENRPDYDFVDDDEVK